MSVTSNLASGSGSGPCTTLKLLFEMFFTALSAKHQHQYTIQTPFKNEACCISSKQAWLVALDVSTWHMLQQVSVNPSSRYSSSRLGINLVFYMMQMSMIELLQALPVHLLACFATQQPQPAAAGMLLSIPIFIAGNGAFRHILGFISTQQQLQLNACRCTWSQQW